MHERTSPLATVTMDPLAIHGIQQHLTKEVFGSTPLHQLCQTRPASPTLTKKNIELALDLIPSISRFRSKSNQQQQVLPLQSRHPASHRRVVPRHQSPPRAALPPFFSNWRQQPATFLPVSFFSNWPILIL